MYSAIETVYLAVQPGLSAKRSLALVRFFAAQYRALVPSHVPADQIETVVRINTLNTLAACVLDDVVDQELARGELCNIAITWGVHGAVAAGGPANELEVADRAARQVDEIRAERPELDAFAARSPCELVADTHVRMLDLFANHVTHPDLDGTRPGAPGDTPIAPRGRLNTHDPVEVTNPNGGWCGSPTRRRPATPDWSTQTGS